MKKQRYRKEKKLGEGATGAVWQATDTMLDRQVAIKYLHAVDDQIHRDLFTAEAKMLARLHHPAITTLFDAVLDDDLCYLVMEFVDGLPLNRLIHREDLSLERGLEIALDILEALRYAHTKGVVHRDIKPENVMLTGKGQVKLTDFGFANLVSLLRRGSDLQIGTPNYMAPEQVRGQPTDERSDLYAFGIMLFEILSGRLPFETDDPEQLLEAQLSWQPESIRTYLPDAPLTIEHALKRLLAKQPEQRYPSAEALLNVLRPIYSRLIYSSSHIQLLTETIPLVERDAQRLALHQAWQSSLAQNKLQLAVISGETGLGKSRLAGDFLSSQTGSYPVLVGRCDDFPYAPFVEIVSGLIRYYPNVIATCATPAQRRSLAAHLPGCASLLPDEPQPQQAPPSPQQAQIEFFETLRLILANLGPSLLFLEDAAAIDEGSLALLRFLIRRLDAPLLILAACRTGEADPWWKALAAAEIELEPLSAAGTRLNLVGLLDAAVSEEAGQAVHRRSEGNPMFVKEVLRHMIETGELAADEKGVWQYHRRQGKSGSLPPTLLNIFRQRLKRLSHPAHKPLAVAALIGPEFEFEVWTEALGDTGLALDALDEAMAARLVLDLGGDDRYAFHPSNLAAVLVESLSPTRRRLLHDRLADILQARPAVAPARLARHCQAANRTGEAAAYWQQAGRQAAASNAHEYAITAFEQANNLQPEQANFESLAALYRQQGRAEPAIEALKQALRLATGPADRARILNNLSFIHWLYDRYRPAYQAAAQALRLPNAPPREVAVSRSHLGMIAWLQGNLADARQHCLAAVQILRKDGDNPAELAAAYNRLGLVYFSAGGLSEALRLFTESLHMREKLDDLWGQAFCWNNLAKVAIERSDFAAAGGQLTRAERMFRHIDSRDGQMTVLANRGRLLLRQGRPEQAREILNRAVQTAIEIGKWSAWGLGDIYLLLAETLLELNRLEQAETALREALRLVETAGNQEYMARGYALQARLLRQQGQAQTAAQQFERAIQTAGQVSDSLVRRLRQEEAAHALS